MAELTSAEEDFLSFLSVTARPDLKDLATQRFLEMTASKDYIELLRNDKFLKAIMDLMQDSQASVAEKAHKAVVNLTAEEEFRSKILSFQTDPDFLTFMLEYVLKPDSMLADIACSILSNLSQSEAGAYKIVQRMVANKELVGFARLIQVFCRENFNTHAKLHYLGPLLSNLTKIKEARLALLDKSQCVIQRLVPYTEYADSVVRRGGVIGALRNCCFETDFHEWLLSDEVDLLPRLLLPLAGPEEFEEDDMDKLPDDLQYLPPDKTREPASDIRCMLLEAIYQLCAKQSCRQLVRERNTYVILRALHTWEKHPSVINALEMLIQILIADEPAQGMENLNEVEIPKDVKEKLEEQDEVMKKQLDEDLAKYESGDQS